MVMISDPAAIKALYTERDTGCRPAATSILEPILGSRSLLLLEGAEHLARRKLMLPPFHGERMRSYEPVADRDRRAPRSTPGRSDASSRSTRGCRR